MELISVIIPCYNEQEAIPYFYEEMCRVEGEMKEFTFELIFVDDGSRDHTIKVVKELASKDSQVKYVSFSRNFGKEAAIYAGLSKASGDYVVMMDVDLQDPPRLLPEMMRAIQEEGYDSVATRRVSRKGEPPIRSFFARRFYRVINKISKTEIVDGARDYRLMTRQFADSLLEMKEYNRFSKGLFGWVGYQTKWMEFENVERIAGETKWSFWKLLVYSIEGIVAFSIVPLSIATVAGLVFCLIAFLAVIVVFIRGLLFQDPVAGWPSLACIILFVSGIQLFCMGILGEYLAKTYLEVKERPIFICKETNIDKLSENEGLEVLS